MRIQHAYCTGIIRYVPVKESQEYTDYLYATCTGTTVVLSKVQVRTGILHCSIPETVVIIDKKTFD